MQDSVSDVASTMILPTLSSFMVLDRFFHIIRVINVQQIESFHKFADNSKNSWAVFNFLTDRCGPLKG